MARIPPFQRGERGSEPRGTAKPDPSGERNIRSNVSVAEHFFLIRFYDQPLSEIEECFELLRMVSPGLVHWAARPLRDDEVAGRAVGGRNIECILIFDSRACVEAFETNKRAQDIYYWYRRSRPCGSVLANKAVAFDTDPMPE